MIKAVIFDMDGVIVDTEYYYQKRRAAFMNELGYSLDGIDLQCFIGENFRSLWPVIEPRVDISLNELEAKYQDYKARHPLYYKEALYPEVKSLIQKLYQQGFKLAVASSSTMKDIERCLIDNQLISYFDVVLSGESFVKTKPNPAIYECAIQKLGIKKEEAMVLEDSEVGISAAKSAGICTVAYHNPFYHLNQSEADYVIEQHMELMNLIKLQQEK